MGFVIPAIDLKDGKCVKLQGGDPKKVLFERDDPVQVAKELSKDFSLLHVIDLDAALGTGDNLAVVREIAKITPIQIGGGIRTLKKARGLLLYADKIIIGTRTDLLNELSLEYKPNQLVLAVDSRGGKVSIKGWTEERNLSPEALALQYKGAVGSFLYTCIDVEGLQSGPDLGGTANMVQVGATIASGGVSSIGDIGKLDALGVQGVVIGSALYSGKINLDEVIEYEKSRGK